MDLPTTRHDKENESVKESRIPEKNEREEKESRLERSSFYVFLATVFLSPLAFIPSPYFSLDVVKIIIISFGILISCILYAIATFKKRTLSFPKGPLAISVLLIIISLIISTLFSTNILKSFIGQGFEIGTTSFLLLMFLTSFFVAKMVNKKEERIFNIYAAVLVSSIILSLFQIVRIIGGVDFMSLGILQLISSSIIGKWFDFSIIVGLSSLLSIFGLKFLSLGRGLKFLLYTLLIISFLLLFVINFNLVWWAIALTSVGILIYDFSSRAKEGTGLKKFFGRISFLTLIVVIVSVVCAWNVVGIDSSVTKYFKLDKTEIILPWQMTLDVVTGTVKESPLFGAGPNRFVNQFLKFKSQGINPTPFYSLEFSNGFGNVPSFVVTEGLFGLIVWLLFFGLFIKYGISVLKKTTSQSKKFYITSSFFITFFLWLINIIYTPSHVMLFFTFIFTGLFFSTLIGEGLMTYKELGTYDGSKTKKYMPITLSVIILILFIGLTIYLKKVIAISYFQGGIKELNTNRNVDLAQTKFKKALSWSESDVYYQSLSETDIMKITNLAQELQKNPNNPDQKYVEDISKFISEALDYTKKAISIDPTNYYNYTAQARISEVGTTLKIPNAYENTKTSYANALSFNPFSPSLYLNLARLEASQNKLTEAEQYIGRALTLKQNYLEAIFLLSQIQVSKGEIKNAIISTQVATQINPTNPLLFFQLGLLHYNDKNYAMAVTALEKAVELENSYANAKYFLGLSYSRLGKNAEAITQFDEIQKTNPDSQEVNFILNNLRAGKSPFTDAVPPVDSKPEKRSTLPIIEKAATKSNQNKSK